MARGALRNRSRLEVSADILRLLSKGPQPRTHVMFGANLSYEMLVPYLEHLKTAGLIEERPAPSAMSKDIRSGGGYRSVYCLTLKGNEALRVLDTMHEALGFFGLKERSQIEVPA
ncbi:MAG: hypothetical protein JRN67_09115 [Nitrososphaerota archaeon]|nr:hypothetical protein [Nitrososphaerota archaeon]